MKPKALGGPVLEDVKSDRRVRLASWLTSEENPFFTRSLVNRVWFHLLGRGIVEPVGRLSRLQPSLQRRSVRRPDQRICQGRLQPQGPDPDDPAQPDPPALVPHERAERRRQPVLLARLDQALAGRGLARRHLDGHRHNHGVRGPAPGRPSHTDARRQDGQPVPQDLRPPRA